MNELTVKYVSITTPTHGLKLPRGIKNKVEPNDYHVFKELLQKDRP